MLHWDNIKRKMIKVIVFIVLFIVNVSIEAQTIVTDRPDQTESSSTVPKGSFQIETGILIGSSKDNGIFERQLLAPSTLLRYGITTGIEIRFVNQYESVKNKTTSIKVNGISDLEIGTKIQLLKKENQNTEIAFLSHLIIPTGSKSLTKDRLGSINKFSISHTVNENFGVGYNFGYNYFGVGKGDFTYSLAFGFSITDKIGFYVEPYGNIIEFKNHVANFDSGFTYLIKNNFQLDASFGTGINHTMTYFSVGMSINISKEKM
jgi:Putative MetA-pathway of phenol degradation